MKNWNILDKLIAKLRYGQVNKYVIKDQTIVDIGCGREAEFLMSHKDKISKGIGFDFRIENKEEGNICLKNNKGRDSTLPLPDNSVDTVFLNAVLEHLTNPYSVLKECRRILKKNGKVVMTTPTRAAKPVLEFMAFKLHIINEDEILEHQHYYNKADVVKLASKLGFKVERYKFFELFMNSLIVYSK